MSENKNVPKVRFPEFEGEWRDGKLEQSLNSQSSTIALNKLKLKKNGFKVYGADSVVGYIDEYQNEDRYISIVKDGSGVGRLNLCEEKSSILGTLTMLQSKNKNVYDLSWLYYLLNTIDFTKYIKGAGIPHIYFSDYKEEKILIPTIDEQQKIADCLSSLDELIAAQTEKLELLKQHKKGLMQQLFPQLSDNQSITPPITK